MNIYESLLAKAINGGGGSDNPNSIQEVVATLENPWGTPSAEETKQLATQYMTAYASGGASSMLEFDLTDFEFGILSNPLDKNTCEGCLCGIDGQGEPDDTSLGYEFHFSDGGSVGNLTKAFMVQNGMVVDVKQFASMIPTKLTICWHPMPMG